MKTKIVSYTPKTLPPLTEARIARLKKPAARPDSEIDTNDAPELTDEQWKNAERGRFYRPIKRQGT
jgi:hypothetical protein